MFLEKNSEPVSRVLFLSLRAGACHLSTASVTAWSLSFHPPARTGRPLFVFAGLHELSTSGVHSTTCHHGPGGLLPRLLTLAGKPCGCLGGCSLLHGLTLASLFPLGSGMPCVARTFLSPHVFRGPATGRSTVSRGQRYEKKSGNTNLFDSSSDSLGFEKASLRAERPSGSAAFTHSLHHAVK